MVHAHKNVGIINMPKVRAVTCPAPSTVANIAGVEEWYMTVGFMMQMPQSVFQKIPTGGMILSPMKTVSIWEVAKDVRGPKWRLIHGGDSSITVPIACVYVMMEILLQVIATLVWFQQLVT